MNEYGEVSIYQTDDGLTKLNVNLQNETVWLTIDQMAELFQRDKSTISRHINKIFKEGELVREATVAFFATVQIEGGRKVERLLYHCDRAAFNLLKRCYNNIAGRGLKGDFMSTAKELIIDRVNNMSDDMDENQMIDRLYMLSRLEHSRKRCQEEGTIKDSELDEHFKEKRRQYAGV